MTLDTEHEPNKAWIQTAGTAEATTNLNPCKCGHAKKHHHIGKGHCYASHRCLCRGYNPDMDR